MHHTKNTSRETVLIVDDIPDNVRVLYEFLPQAGLRVLVAQDGQEALHRVEYAQPDIVLLDIMMPTMDGFEVCEILKSQPSTQEIPIIFMTALSDTVDKLRGFKLGAVDYITKPFQQEEVLARIHTHLRIRRLQDQLKTHVVELEKRNVELNTFSRTVAHDLKNPLTGVIGFADLLLLDKTLAEKSRKHAELISKSGRSMVDIIDALLLLAAGSRSSSQMQIEFHPLDMAKIVSQVIQNRLLHMINEFKGDIILPDVWPTAKGYGPWIEEIWANYLSNALKYGGKPPTLKLGADELPDGRTKFWVQDNGRGLTEEQQAKLFLPFSRLHKKEAEGHGLGLAIVQQIAEKLQGEVGVRSNLDQGSTFYFILPTA